jgi:hypothetical protein
MTRAVPEAVILAARAIGIQPGSLTAMHPQQARKLALQAARIHEGRREMAARALDSLEAFDDVLKDASITAASVADCFRGKGELS